MRAAHVCRRSWNRKPAKDEFGLPRPNFIGEALAEGQRAQRDKQAEAEAAAVRQAQQALEGRDK